MISVIKAVSCNIKHFIFGFELSLRVIFHKINHCFFFLIWKQVLRKLLISNEIIPSSLEKGVDDPSYVINAC